MRRIFSEEAGKGNVMMQAAVWGGLAVAAGFAAGFAARAIPARRERELLETLRRDLARLEAESRARSGFEAVAAERERTIVRLTEEGRELNRLLRERSAEATAALARLEAEQGKTAENLELLAGARQALGGHFEVLAAQILENKSRSLSEGSQRELGSLLTPLREQLREFREKVERVENQSTAGVTELKTLIGGLSGLNRQLSEEARNLATALRGSARAQGDWGEFILRDLLDKAGLREGEEYSFQQSFAVEGADGGLAGGGGPRSASGRRVRTDVVVSLPGGRSLVIDSKVSLTAYTDCVNASGEAERSAALRQHLASVRAHIRNLAEAGYHHLPDLETPDFVVLFVPVEPALLMALQHDPELWAEAYGRQVLLVGPTTLLYVIRIVNVLWQQERQARNVREVMDRGARLYEKFTGFLEDLECIGRSLRDAGSRYELARRKLAQGDGNLVRQVEMLRQLGVKPRRTIPERWLETAGAEQPASLPSRPAEGAEQGRAG